jgi:secondary thiamine-phosphate synthase enzyme
METHSFRTSKQREIVAVTETVKDIVKKSGVKEGICVVTNPHTTAGMTINSYLDPATMQDMIEEFDRLIPTRTDFHHVYDTPSDASGHIKTSLAGSSITVIIHDGELVMGHSQGLLFWEFDGPRDRKIHIQNLSS